MSIRNTVRSLPYLVRTGISEAVAYRAELFVWILTTTMPLVMLALWHAVAREAPVGRFRGKDFVAYFLATFIVRQFTSSWIAWELNFSVRQGTLSYRLLRPIEPLWHIAIDNLATLPLRSLIAGPIAFIGFLLVGKAMLPSSLLAWLLWCIAMLGAWSITCLINVAIGSLSLFMESSIKLMELWLTFYFVFSGYTIPIEIFPPALRSVANWLPFRYQIGLPVEIMTSAYPISKILPLLCAQWVYVAILLILSRALWRTGLRRYAAFGG